MIAKAIVTELVMGDAGKPVLEHVEATALAPARAVVLEVVKTLVLEVQNHRGGRKPYRVGVNNKMILL